MIEKFKTELKNAKNATDYRVAWNNLIHGLENHPDYSIDTESFMKTVVQAWEYMPIAMETTEKVDKSGNKTTTESYAFKRPVLGMRDLDRLQSILAGIKNRQEAEFAAKQMELRLSNMPIACNGGLNRALKSVLWNSSPSKIKSNINKILHYSNRLHDFDNKEYPKAVLYTSRDVVSNSAAGGIGKTYIIDRLKDALDEEQIPFATANLPSTRNPTATNVFAKNPVVIASEQETFLDKTANDIIDKTDYHTEGKYMKDECYKSIANIIGTTNFDLSGVDQTITRRIDAIYCNEALDWNNLSEDEKSIIPNGESIKDAWVYLITHDCSGFDVDISKEIDAGISSEEKDILWVLLDVKALHPTNVLMSEIKAIGDSENKKHQLRKYYDVALKYGAKRACNGIHGANVIEGSTGLDLTNMKISQDIWNKDENSIKKVFDIIDVLFPDDGYHPDDKIDWSELDALLGEEAPVEETSSEDIKTFDKIEESNTWYDTPYSDASNREEAQFEVLNPIAGRRADSGCTSMRNFIFECDETPLLEQKKMAEASREKINRVVFSGNKSLHCRITINYEPESKEEYKWLFTKLNNMVFDGKADKACGNPARLTRKPNGVRIENHRKQIVCWSNDSVLKCEKWHDEYLAEKKILEQKKAEVVPTTFKGKKYDTIAETIENIKSDSEEKEAVVACLDGNASYEEGIKAMKYVKWLGFSYTDWILEIQQGDWNFKESFWDKL